MIILEENFKWHLEAFASELFKCLINILLCNLVLFNFLLILWLLFALYVCFSSVE